jgi:hypothetical protein
VSEVITQGVKICSRFSFVSIRTETCAFVRLYIAGKTMYFEFGGTEKTAAIEAGAGSY